MKKIAFLLMLTICASVYAKKEALIRVTNESNPNIMVLGVDLNSVDDMNGMYIDYFDPKNIKFKEVDMGLDLSGPGVVIYERKNRKVVTVHSQNLNPYSGGEIKIKFLYNGITGSYKSIRLDLKRTSTGWVLSKNGLTVRKLHFVSNRAFAIGEIGIKRIIIK